MEEIEIEDKNPKTEDSNCMHTTMRCISNSMIIRQVESSKTDHTINLCIGTVLLGSGINAFMHKPAVLSGISIVISGVVVGCNLYRLHQESKELKVLKKEREAYRLIMLEELNKISPLDTTPKKDMSIKRTRSLQ